MNKKGQLFVLMVTIFMGIALLTIFISLNNKYSAARKIGTTIGSSASAVIQTYQKQEAALLYLDLSAELALKKSLFELGENGGLEFGECGISIYNLWNTKTKTCFPDYKENLEKIFKKEFQSKIGGFDQISFSTDHEITIHPIDNQVEVTGVSPEKITMVVSKEGGVKQVSTSQSATGGQIINKLYDSIRHNVNRFDGLIQKAAMKYHIPPNIIKGQIGVESSGNPRIINSIGCAGLGQFCTTSAQEYFGDNNIVVIEKEPKCHKEGDFYKCEADIYSQDDRFVPAKMIDAEAKYLKKLTDRYKNKGYSDYYAFGIASYNTGAVNVDKAITKAKDLTKKDDPSWDEIAPFLSKETQKYVPKVNDYNIQFGGQDISLGQGFLGGFDSVIGTLEFGQNFKVKEIYSFDLYDKLIDFANDTIKNCNDDITNCLNEKISVFNSKNNEKIKSLKDCEEGATKVLYDFAENIVDCGDTGSEDCICPIIEDYDAKIKNRLKENQRITFNKFKFGNEFSADPDFIKPTYWVNDWEDVLNSSFEDEINRIISSFEENTGVELGIMTTPDDATNAKGTYDYWGVGKKDEKNGILILASVKNKKADIYVGEGLAKILTQQKVAEIKNKLLNSLDKNDIKKVEAGIREAVDSIIKIIKNKYEKDDFIKTIPNTFDLSIFSKPSDKTVKAKTYHVPWFNNYIFSYDDDGLFDITHVGFTKSDGKKEVQKNWQNIYLYKGKENFSLIYKEDGKFYNESHKEITETVNYCDSGKKIYRLCADTEKNILVFEDNKLQSKDSKIKFALNLVDKVPPPKADNLKVEWLTDIQKVLISWEEIKTDDPAAYYQIYYSPTEFTTATDNNWLTTVWKKVNISDNSSYERLRKGVLGNPTIEKTPKTTSPSVPDVQANQEDSDNSPQTGTDPAISFTTTQQEDFSFLKIKTLYYENIARSTTKKIKYYLLLEKESIINDVEKQQTNLEYYFGVVGFDSSRNSISEQIKALNINIPNLCGAVVEYAKKYLNTGYGEFGICNADDAKHSKCTTQCGSFITNSFRFADVDLTEEQLPKGSGRYKCTTTNNLDTKFKPTDIDKLQTGDIFISTGYKPVGHTGMYVGIGNVTQKTKNKCWLKFTPDINGEPVVIHSTGPVCYNTINELKTQQGRTILGFCRYDGCV